CSGGSAGARSGCVTASASSRHCSPRRWRPATSPSSPSRPWPTCSSAPSTRPPSTSPWPPTQAAPVPRSAPSCSVSSSPRSWVLPEGVRGRSSARPDVRFEPSSSLGSVTGSRGTQFSEVTMSAHEIHEDHDHVHGPDCGHASADHGDHVDYFHDGCAHYEHDGHWDECADAPHVEHGAHEHEHGPGC